MEKFGVLDELESEYRKIYNDYGKKNTNIKESFDIMFKTISNLKNYSSKIELGVKNNIEQFLKPISLISSIDNKNVKLYNSLLLIIKKLITSNLISNNNLNSIITILKDVIENSSDEFNHIKVLETLLLLLNPEFLSISEILVDNILTICFKSISHKNNNIKNTGSAILQQLTSITFYSLVNINEDKSQMLTKVEENNEEHKTKNANKARSSSKHEMNKMITVNTVNNEISKVCKNLFKEFILISEGKGKVQNMMYSRAVGIELLSGIIYTYPVQILTNEYFYNKVAELSKITKKNLESTSEYIIGLKFCRLSIQIIEKLKTGYAIIPCLLKYVERQNSNWQKYIGLECFSTILNDPKIITDLYLLNKTNKSDYSTLYIDLLNTLMKVTFTICSVRQLDLRKDRKNEKRVTKYIDLSSFMMESDNNNPPTLNHFTLMNFVFECFNNLINSFSFMIESNKMKIDSVNNNLTYEQQLVKEIIILSVDCIKNSLTVFLTMSPDESYSHSIIQIFQSFLVLFGCLGLEDAKNSLIKELLKISYNSENKVEIKESNKYLIKELFGIINSTANFLDKEAWAMILEWNMKISLYLANSKSSLVNLNEDEFNVEVLVKRIENNVKKNNKEIETRKENTNRSMILIKGTKELEELNQKPKVIDDTAIQESGSLTNREKKGGLLSSIKNVLGIRNLNKEVYTAPQTKGSITTMKHEEDIIEYLPSIIENVFINSISFTDNSLILFINGLEKNTSNTLTFYGINQNEEYKYSVHFVLVKILEIVIVNVERIDIFLEKLHSIISSIIKIDNGKLSKFCVDLLISISLYVLSNFKFLKNTHSFWEKTTWQINLFKIFSTLCKDIKSNNIKVNILEGISSILYTSSNLISSQGYICIIEICDYFILNPEDVLIEKVSILINDLFSEYKENLNIVHLKSLTDVLAKRCILSSDVNEISSEISMFTDLSNQIEKFQQYVDLPYSEISNIKILNKEQKEFYKNEGNKIEIFNSLWINLFQQFVNICNDKNLDIQKLAIITFGEIFIKKNSFIHDEIASKILNNFLQILEKNYFSYKETLTSTQQKHEEEYQIKTPKFSSGFIEDSRKTGKKASAIRFDDETLKKFNILPEIEDPGKYEEICVLLIQEINRILKNLLSNSDKMRDNQIIWYKLLSDFILIFIKIIKLSSTKLLIICLRTLRDLFFLKNDIIYQFIWNLLNDLGQFLISEFFLSTMLKDQANLLISVIIDFLNEIIIKNENECKEKELLNEENLIILFNFLNNTLYLAKNIDFLQGITNPQKLNVDEKVIFQFIENLVPLLGTYKSREVYCKFVLSFMKYDHKIDHSEAICRKSFELLDFFFENIEDDDNLKYKYLSQILSEVKEICSFISNIEISSKLIKNNKSQMQLWQHSLFILMKIIRSFFEKSTNAFDNYMTQQNELTTFEIPHSYKSQYSSLKGKHNLLEILSEKERFDVWENSVNCFESIFNHTGLILKASLDFNVSKNILEDLVRSCQEMNIQIITFIVNILIPNSFTIDKNLQSKLFSLLDSGCNFDLNSISQLNSSSFSRIVISNLFDLCKFQEEKEGQTDVIGITNIDEFNRIKAKINKITTPILIRKCREILKKYVDDENKSGLMPLSRNRVEDVKFVLENLKTLDIISNTSESDDPEVITNLDLASNNYFQNAVVLSRKAHLFNLIHTFSDLVMTKENDIRLIVKEIFKIISNEIYSHKI